ncbi:MAG: DUF397 domain-containing protein [Streptosporangiaceae bacterium]
MTGQRRKATAAPQGGWRTSSYSGGAGNCVEVAIAGTGDGVGIRDSKVPDGPVLIVGQQAWREFAARVKSGEPRLASREPPSLRTGKEGQRICRRTVSPKSTPGTRAAPGCMTTCSAGPITTRSIAR